MIDWIFILKFKMNYMVYIQVAVEWLDYEQTVNVIWKIVKENYKVNMKTTLNNHLQKSKEKKEITPIQRFWHKCELVSLMCVCVLEASLWKGSISLSIVPLTYHDEWVKFEEEPKVLQKKIRLFWSIFKHQLK